MNQAEFDFTAPPPAPKAEPPKRNRAEVLEKIKKLLRLGRSSNAAEAALAMEHAFRLAREYDVDVAELDLDEAEEKMAHEWFQCGERPGFLRKQIWGILQTYFRVRVCLSRSWQGTRVCFVGRETDVAIACYATDFLTRAGQNCLRDFCADERKARRKVNAAKKQNFTTGFIYGVTERLYKAQETLILPDARGAIILAKEKAEEAARDAYFAELFPKTKQIAAPAKHRRNEGAIMAGFHEGRKTSITTPLAGSAAAPPLLR